MRSYFFSLSVPYDQCENLYITGQNTVILTADSGERIQLPTMNLRPFVDRSGLKGRFKLVIDDKNKVKSFVKVS